ncbi:MAG: radical SAM protein [Anaerolineae bacterium]|nr:radical SAM protein [Anaerolineae bacterium]
MTPGTPTSAPPPAKDARPLLNLLTGRLRALPLLVLYLTDGCNSRCIACDIWKNPRRNMDMALAERLAEDFRALGGRQVLLSGGEAMQHPDWPRIAGLFRAAGARVNLLTNGLALKKDAALVIDHVDSVTVSLDGSARETYQAVRGVDAFHVVLDGIAAVAAGGLPVTTRTTVQRANFREMARIVDVAVLAGAHTVSFLAVDVRNPQAFGPRFVSGDPLVLSAQALTRDDLPEFASVLDALEASHAAHFAAGRIAESPAKLRRLHTYFAALNGMADFEPPACNAPHFSAVVEVDGAVRSCYFLPATGSAGNGALADALNTPEARAMRRDYRAGRRPECEACVCPLYRGPRALWRGL